MTPELEKQIFAFCEKNARIAQANCRSMHELVAVTVAKSLVEFYKILEDNLHGQAQEAQVLSVEPIVRTTLEYERGTNPAADAAMDKVQGKPIVARGRGRPRKDEVRQIEI